MGDCVAIVGSREWPDEIIEIARAKVWEIVFSLPKDTTIISGEAVGVDTWAKDAAGEAGLAYIGYPPRYDLYPPRQAPLKRNIQIVKACDRVVAFQHSSRSSGTSYTIERARRAGKQVDVIEIV